MGHNVRGLCVSCLCALAEIEVRDLLKDRKKVLRETVKRFNKYDNIDDMHYIDVIEGEIDLIKKILGEVTGGVK